MRRSRVSKTTWTTLFVSVAFTLVTTLGLPFELGGVWEYRLKVLALVFLALAVLGWLVAFLPVLQRLRLHPTATHPMTLLLVGIVSAGIGIGIWLLTDVPSTPVPETDDGGKPPIGSDVLSSAQVVSLYRLFKEDVPGIKSIDFQPVLLHVQSSNEGFGVEPRLHADFVGLSMFVSFYIPSSPAVRDIIRFISDNYSTLTGIDQIELVLTKPGEYPRSTETMKFTGSIVLYHEDALSNADLAVLENYYSERKLTPVWRSTAYVQSQTLLRRDSEALDRLLKVPPAMQKPRDDLLAVTGITAGVDGERIQIRNKGPRATR